MTLLGPPLVVKFQWGLCSGWVEFRCVSPCVPGPTVSHLCVHRLVSAGFVPPRFVELLWGAVSSPPDFAPPSQWTLTFQLGVATVLQVLFSVLWSESLLRGCTWAQSLKLCLYAVWCLEQDVKIVAICIFLLKFIKIAVRVNFQNVITNRRAQMQKFGSWLLFLGRCT